MSLILEALRKSEAERRRGQAPDVLADMPAAQPAARRTLPTWTWIVPVVLIMLAAIWWWQRDAKPSSPPPTSIAAATKTISAQQPAAAALPPVPRFTPPPVVPEQQAVAATSPSASHPMHAAPRQPAAASQDLPQQQASARATSAASEPAQTATAPAVQPTLPPAPTTAPPTPPSEAITSKPEPAGNRVESLSDLSTADRQALPPLKLSMHLWNADPARRFVILDGNRVVEGDRVGNAVVRSITRDSVVLDWNGRQIKLPVR